MKFSARRAAWRGRTRRSPRMSCSPITAASAVSNPLSSPSTASATSGFGSASASAHDATGERLARPWSASTWRMRSRAPSLHKATTTRLLSDCKAKACAVTASNTLATGLGPLGGEVAPLLGAGVDGWTPPFRQREGRKPGHLRLLEALPPFRLAEIKSLRRQRMVGRSGHAGRAPAPRFVVVLDLERSARGRRLPPAARARPQTPADSRRSSPGGS